jgi:hypothetical protein
MPDNTQKNQKKKKKKRKEKEGAWRGSSASLEKRPNFLVQQLH